MPLKVFRRPGFDRLRGLVAEYRKLRQILCCPVDDPGEGKPHVGSEILGADAIVGSNTGSEGKGWLAVAKRRDKGQVLVHFTWISNATDGVRRDLTRKPGKQGNLDRVRARSQWRSSAL